MGDCGSTGRAIAARKRSWSRTESCAVPGPLVRELQLTQAIAAQVVTGTGSSHNNQSGTSPG